MRRPVRFCWYRRFTLARSTEQLVGRDVELEASRLSLFDERTVLQLRPATFERGFNGMITEGAT